MARNHHSYLVRCWEIGTGSQRIEIEHIQSGNRTVVGSLEAAIVWLKADPDRRVSEAIAATRPCPVDRCRKLDQ